MVSRRLREALISRYQVPLFLDDVFLAVGKSLGIAQEFEQHARFAVGSADAAHRVQEARADGVEDLWKVLTSRAHPKFIGKALEIASGIDILDADYLLRLRYAKNARNAIAHEGALLPTHSVSALACHAGRLISWVEEIDSVDTSLTRICHQIEEPNENVSPLAFYEQVALSRRQELIEGLAPLLSAASRHYTFDGLSPQSQQLGDVLSIWTEHELQTKVIAILTDVHYERSHHFGRPFLTAYQLAIELDRRWPAVRQALGYPLGGEGGGTHGTFAQYIARELSRRLNAGSLTQVEGAFLTDEHLVALEYESNGNKITSTLTGSGADLSMFRLREPAV